MALAGRCTTAHLHNAAATAPLGEGARYYRTLLSPFKKKWSRGGWKEEEEGGGEGEEEEEEEYATPGPIFSLYHVE